MSSKLRHPDLTTPFKSLVPPLSPEERQQLESNILRDGCRDPLAIWKDHDALLDGHNRLEICLEHDLPWDEIEIELEDQDAAEDWIDANQLGRRNLTPDQFNFMMGRRYNRTKNKHGGLEGNRNAEKRTDQNEQFVLSSDQPDAELSQPTNQSDPGGDTADRMAKDYSVSRATVVRAGQFVDATDKLKSIDPDLEAKIVSGQAPPRAAVIKAAQILEKSPEKAKAILDGTAKTADVIREIKREDIRSNLESIETKEAKAIEGVYDVIVIDPPWPMEKIERDERPNQSEFEYPTMSEAELEDLKIPVAKDCHVWLWTTHRFLPLAISLLECWDLNYVCTFVWHKPGGFQPIGLPQFNCEFALYARHGSPTFLDTKAFNVCFEAARGRHSEKPSEFYELVNRVTAGRKLDMFNRRVIDGFDGWGKEAGED